MYYLFIYLFINRSLLEYNCFTILCQFLLYTKVNQLYIYICLHIPSLLSLPPTLPIPHVQVIAKHPADLPVLCCFFPLANYFTFGSVYMSMLLSLRPSFPLHQINCLIPHDSQCLFTVTVDAPCVISSLHSHRVHEQSTHISSQYLGIYPVGPCSV